MNLNRSVPFSLVFCALTLGAAAKVGDTYIVSGRCVTVTRIDKGQAEYQWSSGNASGSGNLPANRLTEPCSAPAAVPPAGTTQPVPVSGALTPVEQKAMIDAHNALRAGVGVGPLAWDPALADYSQRHVATMAASCEDSHGSASEYGENNAAWLGGGSPTQAIAIWNTEKPKYRGAGGPFTDTDSRAAGHYTQMVWRSSIQMGCGRIACSKNGKAWTIVSCNYSPRGNQIGIPVY